MINYDKYRNESGVIDLHAIYAELKPDNTINNYGARYLVLVQDLMPINSRQAAALAIANARILDEVHG